MAIESMALADVPVEEDVSTGVLHDVYVEQVREIYPHGTTFYCARGCGHTMPVTVHQLAEITAVGGWPKHCGVDMRIGDNAMEVFQ
jgi:hypothetical protein